MGQPELAARARLSVRALRSALASLRAAGLVDVKRSGGTAEYTLTTPAQPFVRVPRAIIEDTKLGLHELLTVVALTSFCQAKRWCRVGQMVLAERAQLSVRALEYALRTLKPMGLVKVKRTGRSSFYTLAGAADVTVPLIPLETAEGGEVHDVGGADSAPPIGTSCGSDRHVVRIDGSSSSEVENTPSPGGVGSTLEPPLVPRFVSSLNPTKETRVAHSYEQVGTAATTAHLLQARGKRATATPPFRGGPERPVPVVMAGATGGRLISARSSTR